MTPWVKRLTGEEFWFDWREDKRNSFGWFEGRTHLEEEDKGHPLIVGMHRLLTGLGTKSRVSTTCPWHAEGGHDPAVGVEEASRDSLWPKAGDSRAWE